jgi:cephalosporin hydroxylase
MNFYDKKYEKNNIVVSILEPKGNLQEISTGICLPHRCSALVRLCSPNSYCIVFDTVIEDMPDDMFHDRPWGDNPKTAVREYLRRLKEEGRTGADGFPLNFEINKTIEHKLLITVASGGYLRVG